jgi:hypothetical protein
MGQADDTAVSRTAVPKARGQGKFILAIFHMHGLDKAPSKSARHNLT